MKEEPPYIVICDNCKNSYPLVFTPDIYHDYDPDQGVDCCTIVSEDCIKCSYGSKYDDDTFLWTNSFRPEIYSNYRNVCDKCIERLITDGIIVKKEVNQYLVFNL